MSISISDLVRSPYKLNDDTLLVLREYVAEHPYDQTARLLLLYNLYLLRDERYSELLHRHAIYLADRNILYRATEGQSLKLVGAEHKKPTPKFSKQKERSNNLIDRFLRQHEVEESGRAASSTPKADPSGDYMAYWAQQHGVSTSEPAVEDEGQMNALLHAAAIRPLHDMEEAAAEMQEVQEVSEGATASENEGRTSSAFEVETAEEELFATENMAKIYIKQGRYERAIEILRTLSAHNPKKNSYFADQIRFLHKLAINSRYVVTET